MITHFSGWVTNADPEDLRDGASPSLQNVGFQIGRALRVRPGLLKLDAAAASGKIRTMAVCPIGPIPHLVWCSDDDIQADDTTS